MVTMKKAVAVCGCDCRGCAAYPAACAGCREIRGCVSWACGLGVEVCPIYDCCAVRHGFSSCGECPELPCETFTGLRDPAQSREEFERELEARIVRLREMRGGRKSIRKLGKAGLPEALRLVKNVFMEFEAPEYSEEGIGNFLAFIRTDNMEAMLDEGRISLYCCYAGDRLAGIICMQGGNHVSLLFVDPDFHRRGIATALFEEAKRHCPPGTKAVTVHSSAYALPVYSRWGFCADGPEQVEDGIRFTPMTCPLPVGELE